jgi:hypothetical protein
VARTRNDRDLIEDGGVARLLRCQALEGVFFALDLEPGEKAIHNRDVDSEAALEETQLLDDEGIPLLLL